MQSEISHESIHCNDMTIASNVSRWNKKKKKEKKKESPNIERILGNMKETKPRKGKWKKKRKETGIVSQGVVSEM